jgi:hypothetical protein
VEEAEKPVTEIAKTLSQIVTGTLMTACDIGIVSWLDYYENVEQKRESAPRLDN